MSSYLSETECQARKGGIERKMGERGGRWLGGGGGGGGGGRGGRAGIGT